MKLRYIPQARQLLIKLVSLIEAAERNGENVREVQHVLLRYTSLIGLRHDQTLTECLAQARVAVLMAERAENDEQTRHDIRTAELFTRKVHDLLVALNSDS